VVGIRGAGEIRLVAGIAVGRNCREVVIHVAGRAGHGFVRARQREGGLAVVKDCACPGRCRMANHTIRREARRLVIGICGPVVILGVTSIAVGGQSGEVVVHVACGAGHGFVRAGQREGGLVVIEDRARPSGGGMAGLARGGEARLSMVGTGGAVVILGVAGIAVGRNGREVVIHVARSAGHCGVRASQREGSLVVVKDGARPGRRVMANHTSCGQARGLVIGISGPVVILGVAGIAIRGRAREDIIDVAGGAGHGFVRTGQRERSLIVIEGGARPGSSVVAGCA